MRKILVVGAGQSGLQLALGLQSQGYEVTLMSNRTADEIRSGRVMSTQCMFRHGAPARARSPAELLGVPGPEDRGTRRLGRRPRLLRRGPRGPRDRLGGQARRVRAVGRPAGQDGRLDGDLRPARRPAGHPRRGGLRPRLLRPYLRPGAGLGGQGRAGLDVRPGRRRARPTASRSAPSRSRTSTGSGPRPEHPDYDAVRCNLVPGRRRAVRHADAHHLRPRRHPLLGGHTRAARWTSSTASRTRRSTSP